MKVKITTPSIFKFLKIIKKTNINFKEIVKKFDNKDLIENAKENQKELGLELFTLLIENSEKAEEDVYEFFAMILGITNEEFLEMDIFEDVLPILSEYKGWQGFFTKLASLEKNLKK